jgi:hypothetical protein
VEFGISLIVGEDVVVDVAAAAGVGVDVVDVVAVDAEIEVTCLSPH